jgi:hypothetical protein
MYFETALNDAEKAELNKYKKVIVWGFPLHTHTHSYIHAMWVKVFKEGFNKDTYWFHDADYPTDFDYENAIFITEGYADKNIPIRANSVYFVHNAILPDKYIDAKSRLIEIRFNVKEIHDVNNDFKLDDGTHEAIIQLSAQTNYEKLFSNKDLHARQRQNQIKPMNYECVYLYWATDLLPHEFDFNISYSNSNRIYYVGSPAITPNLYTFKQICEKNGLEWIHINPWNTPLTFEDNIKAMKTSVLCPDFRPIGSQHDIQEFGIKNGKNHMEIGYLPCRVLKAISYGKIGITDSVHIKHILGDHVLYDSNMSNLFAIAMNESDNKERIISAMKHVQENHTYVQRARDLIRALLQ